MVKNLPARQEIQVLSLGWENPLEIFQWIFQSTPVFLPGESHVQRSLKGYNLRCCRVGHDCSRHIRLMIKYKNLPKGRVYTILYKI